MVPSNVILQKPSLSRDEPEHAGRTAAFNMGFPVFIPTFCNRTYSGKYVSHQSLALSKISSSHSGVSYSRSSIEEPAFTPMSM